MSAEQAELVARLRDAALEDGQSSWMDPAPRYSSRALLLEQAAAALEDRPTPSPSMEGGDLYVPSGRDAPSPCHHCDFSSGQRGMDRCSVCDGTGSVIRRGRLSKPAVEPKVFAELKEAARDIARIADDFQKKNRRDMLAFDPDSWWSIRLELAAKRVRDAIARAEAEGRVEVEGQAERSEDAPNSPSHLIWRLRNNDTAKHLCGLAADEIERLLSALSEGNRGVS